MRLDRKIKLYAKRKKRIRKKIIGIKTRPRLSVFKSSKHIYAQAIDDSSGCTLASMSSLKGFKDVNFDYIKKENEKLSTPKIVGFLVGKKLLKKNIKKIAFDRNGFPYKGKIEELANGVRDAGLCF
jgi:large subunit ribosomal protein L18